MSINAKGVVSASLSPLAMTFGFILWGKSWKSSAFNLNVFKCTLAGVIFMIVSFAIRPSMPVTVKNQAMILLSSFLGIIVGDNTWLIALQMIGAKRVIIIDTLKPLLAALLGNWILNEPLSVWTFIGILLATIGILMVSLEKQGEVNEEPGNGKERGKEETTEVESSSVMVGYSFAAVNVILDAFGSVLTKQFGADINTWEINYLRFGFAAIFMGLGGIAMTIYRYFRPSSYISAVDLDSLGNKSQVNKPWYIFPRYEDMSPFQWASVSVGVLFVTFLCPALSNYALFEIPLGLCLTLTSLGPVYSIPLVFLLNGETTGIQGIIGAFFSVLGIGIIFIK